MAPRFKLAGGIDNGSVKSLTKALRKRVIKYRAHGLIPSVGQTEVVFRPIIGLRIDADGYETWVKFLNRITPDGGRRLENLTHMPITVRFKLADRVGSP